METLNALKTIVGETNVLPASAAESDYSRDECLTTTPQAPEFVVKPVTTDQVARVLRFANEHRIPVTPRGAGTGLSGACVAGPKSIVLSFERMNRILEIDEANHVAIVQPGVTLAELDEATAPKGLIYPIFPGENSATLGGNVATNAGGMRAVKYGVTRHHVLGLEAVLANGDVIRTGGKFVKVSSGYDLTQLLIGSEGTLAVVTEVTVKLSPRLRHQSTMLVPFSSLEQVSKAVPAVIATGVGPLMVEYIDKMTMWGITSFSNIELGVDAKVQDVTQAYLLVVVEGRTETAVEQDLEVIGSTLSEHGAIDVYVLPSGAATQLVDAREKSFWAGKRAGVADILDIVVPRGQIPNYVQKVAEIGAREQSMVVGCGHAGDGNIHLGVFQQDPAKLEVVMKELLSAGLALGGAISAEHGIGRAKKKYLMALEDRAKLDLMRGIKRTFDPNNILNPGIIFD